MINRESIIVHLDDLRMFADIVVHPVVSPENWNVYSKLCNYIDLIKDEVETLLKEQEPVEPIPPTDESDLWKCGNCNHQLFRCTHQRYCEMCGKKVKWNG